MEDWNLQNIYINNLINVSVNTFLWHYLQQNYYQALINL